MARPAMKFAQIEDANQHDELVDLWKTHHCHYARTRAHAILLSAQGYSISSLVDIFGVDRDSVSTWIDWFEIGGVQALIDEDRPGGPPVLDDEEQKILRNLIRRFPNRPSKVLSELKQRTGKEIHESSLRNYARRFGLTWKRFRRSLRNSRSEQAFRRAQAELRELLKEPKLDVVYFDEAGFSLKGVVPYGWLPVGEQTEVPVTGAHGSSVQVMGFEHPDGSIDAYMHKGYVNSETVIEVLEDFSHHIEQTTVVILDNASCHTSAAFTAHLDAWAERGLLIYYIPPYSPELNHIEGFWKRLKYHLMPATAWERFATLLNTLTTKLCEIGQVTYMPSLQSYAE